MVRILLAYAAALAACTSSSQETAMNKPIPDQANVRQGSAEAASGGRDSSPSKPADHASRDQERAAVAPPLELPSQAGKPLRRGWGDSPTEAFGRRILSTAFVQVGPDGLLTVKLHSGGSLVLRNVVMNPKDYCGTQVSGGKPGGKYCGGYAEVAAARPGGTAFTD